MYLGQAIIAAAKKKGINPYKTPFKPSDLGLKSSNYGAFADWCAVGQTKSAKYNPHVCLTVAQKTLSGKPYRYLLIPQNKGI